MFRKAANSRTFASLFHQRPNIITTRVFSTHDTPKGNTLPPVDERDQISKKEEKLSISFLERQCSQLNKSFKSHPMETLISIVGMEIGSIYGVHSLIQCTPLVFPIEFAIAFAINRVLRRIRFPIDILNAKILASFFPPLSTVKVLGAYQNLESKGVTSRITKLMNSYGLCYLISSRFGGVMSVFSIYAALHYGVDIEPLMSYFSTTPPEIPLDTVQKAVATPSFWERYHLGEVAGGWAASVVISSSIAPITYFMAPYPAFILRKLRKIVKL